jgi:proline iminopeptidase
LCSHYFSHGAWLQEGELLANAHRLSGIAGVLIQGRMDMGGFDTAWELAQAWPDAELAVIERSGHSGSEAMTARQVATLDRLAGK